MKTKYIKTDAKFSPCEKCRYTLTREWNLGGKQMMFIGLNPSIADACKDDPTIRRCVEFAKREGCDKMIMCNLFAFCATDPEEMKEHKHPIGDDNDRWLIKCAKVADCVVACWGNHGLHGERGDAVLVLLKKHKIAVHCLKKTGKNQPAHPLYLSAKSPLIPC